MRGHFRRRAAVEDRGRISVDHEVMKGVFFPATPINDAEEALDVRLVVREEEGNGPAVRSGLGNELEAAERRVRG